MIESVWRLVGGSLEAVGRSDFSSSPFNCSHAAVSPVVIKSSRRWDRGWWTKQNGRIEAGDRGVLCAPGRSALDGQTTLLWALKGCSSLQRRTAWDSHGKVGEFHSLAATSGQNHSSGSYLSMWKAAVERSKREEQKEQAKDPQSEGPGPSDPQLAGDDRQREEQFFSILSVPDETRRNAEQQQTVDRAAAAIAAAQALLSQLESSQRLERQVSRGRATVSSSLSLFGSSGRPDSAITQNSPSFRGITTAKAAEPAGPVLTPSLPSGEQVAQPAAATGAKIATRGPDFWSWVPPTLPPASTPPVASSQPLELQPKEAVSRASATAKPAGGVAVLEWPSMPAFLDLPLQSGGGEINLEGASAAAAADLHSLLTSSALSLPPLQSEVHSVQPPKPLSHSVPQDSLGDVITRKAQRASLLQAGALSVGAEAVREEERASLGVAAQLAAEGQTEGVMADGSRWWRSTGVDAGADGEVCEWTVVRGVSADGAVEWEEKWWEVWDAFDYKELGAEKSGRSADGAVWREAWQEATWQDKKTGLTHIEKSADKWGQDGRGGEWHEKWWEHYDALERAEKWADKWSRIDPGTPLEEGHAHVWHERWGEEFDGRGACSKYCDKWAERCLPDGAGWAKWGDKWDEKFGADAHGYKRGETWWEGASGERWNRTWSEGHNNSGWVHKQGRSSSGETWNVHEPMETWFERKPHFGFRECMQQSQRLHRVGKKKKSL